MKEKDLIPHLISDNMPNIEDVRNKCINQTLSSSKDISIKKWHKKPVIAILCFITIFLVFRIPIIKVGATKLIYEIQKLFTINDKQVNLGFRDWIDINIPDNMILSDHDGSNYYSKVYNNMKELEADIQYDFLELQGDLSANIKQIYLNLKDDKTGIIIILFDFYGETIEETTDSDGNLTYRHLFDYKSSNTSRPYRLIMNFNISPESKINETILQDGIDSYSYLATDVGLVQNKDARQTYAVAYQYSSDNLNIEVTIVESTQYTRQSPSYNITTFSAYFIYNNVEYQIEANSIPYLKQIIEDMK